MSMMLMTVTTVTRAVTLQTISMRSHSLICPNEWQNLSPTYVVTMYVSHGATFYHIVDISDLLFKIADYLLLLVNELLVLFPLGIVEELASLLNCLLLLLCFSLLRDAVKDVVDVRDWVPWL